MNEFRPIARAARYIWAFEGFVFITIFGLLFAGALGYSYGWPAFLVSILVAASVDIWWWWLSGRRWRAWGYATRERDLVIRRGLLVKHLTIVPYGRMQFIEVRQGPFDRFLGTASLKLHTAAAATDAEIPLLPQVEADRLREKLTDLGEAHAAGL